MKSSKKLDKMPLSCTHPDCSYATEAVAENVADMLELLKIHAMTCHTTMTSVGTPTHQAQAERVKRPILSLSRKMLDPEEFKDRLGATLAGWIILLIPALERES